MGEGKQERELGKGKVYLQLFREFSFLRVISIFLGLRLNLQGYLCFGASVSFISLDSLKKIMIFDLKNQYRLPRSRADLKLNAIISHCR